MKQYVTGILLNSRHWSGYRGVLVTHVQDAVSTQSGLSRIPRMILQYIELDLWVE